MSDIIRIIKKNLKVKTSIKDSSVARLSEETEKEKLQLALHNQYSLGFADGEKAAKELLELEFNQKITQKYTELDNFLIKLNRGLTEHQTQFENLVINVGFILAEKILKKELQRETVIKDVLDETLKKVLGANEILIRLNPKDYDSIISDGNNYKLNDSFTKIRFEKDERIDIGGCFVESEIGNADGRISSQLNELRKKIDNDINSNVGMI